jgi:zinc protease
MTLRTKSSTALLLVAGLAVAGCASAPAQKPQAPTAASPSGAPPPEPPPVAAAEAPGMPRDEQPPLPPRTTPDAEFRQKPPPPGAERAFKVPAVKRFRLKNGLRVILAQSNKLPLVSVEMVVKTGGAGNPKGQAGLADLVANMLDEGTKTRSALQIADEVSFLGASLTTGASWDASSISVTTLTEHVDKALAVWADVVLNPAFDDRELGRIRENLLTALARRKDSPPTVASLAFSRLLYGEAHPYAWPNFGTEESLKSLGVEDLRKFYDRFYSPANAVLVAAGDISEADLRTKMEALLGGWKAKPAPRVDLPKPQVAGKTKIFLIDKAGAPQSSIRVGLLGIERRNPDYHKAMVMNHILGGSFKRLGLNLREQKGWTYGVSSVFEARRTPGPWVAGGEFVAAKTAESVAEILKEMRGMRDVAVSDKELQETKDEIIKAFPARFSTVNQIAGQMAALAVYDLPDNELDTFTKKIAAVTSADVKKMAEKYLLPEKLVIVVVGDQKSNETALRKIAEVEPCDLDGRPLTATKTAAAAPAAGSAAAR